MPGQTRVENPKLAYRVYPDGREELVRKAEFTGITDALFKEIIAASDASTVYSPGPGGGSVRRPDGGRLWRDRISRFRWRPRRSRFPCRCRTCCSRELTLRKPQGKRAQPAGGRSSVFRGVTARFGGARVRFQPLDAGQGCDGPGGAFDPVPGEFLHADALVEVRQ